MNCAVLHVLYGQDQSGPVRTSQDNHQINATCPPSAIRHLSISLSASPAANLNVLVIKLCHLRPTTLTFPPPDYYYSGQTFKFSQFNYPFASRTYLFVYKIKSFKCFLVEYFPNKGNLWIIFYSFC